MSLAVIGEPSPLRGRFSHGLVDHLVRRNRLGGHTLPLRLGSLAATFPTPGNIYRLSQHCLTYGSTQSCSKVASGWGARTQWCPRDRTPVCSVDARRIRCLVSGTAKRGAIAIKIDVEILRPQWHRAKMPLWLRSGSFHKLVVRQDRQPRPLALHYRQLTPIVVGQRRSAADHDECTRRRRDANKLSFDRLLLSWM